jgi:anionic cell wall polymer biosynthesis LytR-Cps2A-Psr (LCP) family protein
MEFKLPPKKTILLAGIYIGLYLLFSLASYLFFKTEKIFVENTPPEEFIIQDEVAAPAAVEANQANILLLGRGGAGHEGGNLTDSIILVVPDIPNKKIVLISVPRDLWIPLPLDGNKTISNKINFAYSLGLDDKRYPNKIEDFSGKAGGGNLAKYAVTTVTGIAANYFASVDFNQFQKIIDLVGGINVNVPRTFDDFFYPIRGQELNTCGFSNEEMAAFHQTMTGFTLEKQFTCRYEHIHFDEGANKMTGEDVLKFVRSRHSNDYGGDFARSERQFAVLEGLKERLLSYDVIPKGGAIIDKISAFVTTDLSPAQISELFGIIDSPEDYQIIKIQLTEDNVLTTSVGPQGQFILVPKEGFNKWSAVQKYVTEQINAN